MTKKAKAPARELATIVAEIYETYRNDTANIIKRGNLLIEAKAQVKREHGHGQWLAWLDENFSMDARTAQNAMRAAKFAVKYETDSFLNLSVDALYRLSAGDYPQNVVNAVMNEAETKPINTQRIWEIEDSLAPKPETVEKIQAELKAEEEAEEQRRAAEEAEANAILDDPPPELPAAEPIAPVDFVLLAFDQAIGKLKELSTKPSAKFKNSSHSSSDIEKVAEFLHQLARKHHRADTERAAA